MKSYNQTSEFIQGTKMQLAMCIKRLDILNIKGLEAEAQSRKKQKSVRSGRRQFSPEIGIQKLRQPFVNVFFFLFLHFGTGLQKEQVHCQTQAV